MRESLWKRVSLRENATKNQYLWERFSLKESVVEREFLWKGVSLRESLLDFLVRVSHWKRVSLKESGNERGCHGRGSVRLSVPLLLNLQLFTLKESGNERECHWKRVFSTLSTPSLVFATIHTEREWQGKRVSLKEGLLDSQYPFSCIRNHSHAHAHTRTITSQSPLRARALTQASCAFWWVCCSVLQCVAVCFKLLSFWWVCCSVVCCSVLQCVAACCKVLSC